VTDGSGPIPSSPAAPGSGHKSSRPSNSGSSKPRQRTVRENAKPRGDSPPDPQKADDYHDDELSQPSAIQRQDSGNDCAVNGSPAPGVSRAGRRHVRDTSSTDHQDFPEPVSRQDSDLKGGPSREGRRRESKEATTRRRNPAWTENGGTSEDDSQPRVRSERSYADAIDGGDSTFICTWLNQLGLSQYNPLFCAHHVNAGNLEDLDKEALQLIGVQSWGHRTLILKHIGRLKGANSDLPSASTEEENHSRPAARKKGERDKSSAVAALPTTTSTEAHDNLKDVYDQMENIKMHFEAQLEQLNRELLAAKSELAAVKTVLATSQPSSSSSANGLPSLSKWAETLDSPTEAGKANGIRSKGARRKDGTPADSNGDQLGKGESPFASIQGQMAAAAQYIRQVAQQPGMAYGQQLAFANMMHPSAQQYYYGGLGMGMGTGYEAFDAASGQYYVQPMLQQQGGGMQGVGAEAYAGYEQSMSGVANVMSAAMMQQPPLNNQNAGGQGNSGESAEAEEESENAEQKDQS